MNANANGNAPVVGGNANDGINAREDIILCDGIMSHSFCQVLPL
jgi:hypothetical protein